MHRLFTPFLLVGLIIHADNQHCYRSSSATSLYFNHLHCQYWPIIPSINYYAVDGWNVLVNFKQFIASKASPEE